MILDLAILRKVFWYNMPLRDYRGFVSHPRQPALSTSVNQSGSGIVGVDVGVRYLAVTATRRGEQSFYTGKRVVPKANHYARLRKRLQKKGTRSATRRLVAGCERSLSSKTG
jgi:transposase